MNEQALLEQVVLEVLRRMPGESEAAPDASAPAKEAPMAESAAEAAETPPSAEMMEHPRDPAVLGRMRERTAARIGVGRAGPRLRTRTLLTFRADHARAREAVTADVSDALLERMGLFAVSSLCRDRDQHLTRPDLGRRLSDEALAAIRERCAGGPRVQVYVSDGLSSAAIDANIPDFLPALSFGLERYGIGMGTPFFLRFGRVPAMDAVSEVLDAEVTCVLIGERPGLVTADSMSAYIAYRAAVGMPESRRTVVSNIHRGGLASVEAGAYVAEVIKKVLERKASGVELRQ